MVSFFTPSRSISLADIATMVGAVCPSGSSSLILKGIATLKDAQPTHISFLTNGRYARYLQESKAGAVLVKEAYAHLVPAATVALVVPDPHMAFALVAQAFYPIPTPPVGISEQAFVHPTATIGAGVSIAPFAYVGADAVLGAGVVLYPHVVVGDGVHIGDYSVLHAHVSIHYAHVGQRCCFLDGARIGTAGFGFALGAVHRSVPQIGAVHIGNDVDIGANTTIDRGALQDTIIGDMVKIDNLVQISHNVIIGKGTVIAGCAVIAGSTTIGQYVIIGGHSSIVGHITIGDGAQIGGATGVGHDLEPKAVIMGYRGELGNLSLRMHALLKKMVLEKQRGRS